MHSIVSSQPFQFNMIETTFGDSEAGLLSFALDGNAFTKASLFAGRREDLFELFK